jgi:hypothetical protein
MEPNNNQPIQTNPVQQPALQPMPPIDPTPVVPPTPAPTLAPETPKGKSSKAIILLVILLLLAMGIIAYILFAKNQMNSAQKMTTDNSSSVLPTPTTVPTLAPEKDLEISSPEGDIIDIETDIKGL